MQYNQISKNKSSNCQVNGATGECFAEATSIECSKRAYSVIQTYRSEADANSKPHESNQQFPQIINLINKYPYRKIKIGRSDWSVACQKLRCVQFNEATISQDVSYEQIIQMSEINAERYTIKKSLPLKEIQLVYASLQAKQHGKKSKMFQIQFYIATPNMLQLTVMIDQWSKSYHCTCDLQKVVIYDQQQSQLLLSLERSKLYGLSVCLYKHSDNRPLTLKILELFKNCNFFVSISFLDWQPHNHEPLQYIFSTYQHRSKYLLKFANYLEITEFRLFINTTGMKKQEVSHIFELMKHAGHYQLVCHSTKQYFEEVINFFLCKPLIYFKYFVPLAETQELQGAIEAMMEKAELLRKKIEVFVKMLKSPYKLQLPTIIKVFLAMSKTRR